MEKQYTFEDFLGIIALLRSENGCPWDREQTHTSITRNLIEEAYEAVEALESGRRDDICEELGDVLLQVVFHAQIGTEENDFTMQDIINTVSEKMVRRHPHVFADVVADTSLEVLKNWDEIKKQEKSHKTSAEGLKAVSSYLPALMRSEKVIKKAKKAGVKIPELPKLGESISQKIGTLAQMENASVNPKGILEEEMGKILFLISACCRQFSIDAEAALKKTTEKFIRNYEQFENAKSLDNTGIESLI